MRHHNANRKFGLERGRRRALLKSLARSLLLLGKIETTEAKAKELRPLVEKLVTRAKKPSIANRRLLVSRTGSVSATAKLMRDIAPKYSTRKGGYTRVIKLAPARGDGSKRAIIEFV